MTIKYQKVWNTMNELETVTSKICSAREILDCAIDAHQEHKHEKVEHLLNAVDEFLQYYLQDFDNKFKDAWKATVGDLRDGDVEKWNAWEETHYPEEYNKNVKPNATQRNINDYSTAYKGPDWSSQYTDKVTKWQLPLEIDPSGEYFVTFPDDLLEAANLGEGDTIEWVDQGDGSYLLKKVQPSWVEGNELARVKTYDEMIKDGWSMTDDGFWIKEN